VALHRGHPGGRRPGRGLLVQRVHVPVELSGVIGDLDPDVPARAEPNQIVLRIDPDPGLRLQLSALGGQSWRTVHLDTSFARELGEPPEPYEVLLHAAMAGDHQYFAREDSVEETWRIVQPLLGHPPDVRPYPRGSWGPEEAETLLRGHPRWQQPWLPEEG
jgi:glucose-6-phosphate 1-dehydrogenase